MDNTLPAESTNLPRVIATRPMLMLTGFLGAGKTTLLRALLDDLATRNHLADVILNDRENARLDRETLRDHAASVAALTGSCVCCDGVHDLCRLIIDLSDSKHNLLFIELNGTSDPIPLQETFTLMKSKFSLQPRWQVCVIDSRFFGNRGHYNELEKLQLETATHYYISWSSELTGKAMLQLENKIRAINPHASRTTASLLADSLSRAIRNNRRHTLATTKTEQTPPFTLASKPSLPSKSEIHDRHQIAHEFTGANIIIPKPVKRSHVNSWLENLPESVIRAKALVTLDTDLDCRFLFERVGKEVSPQPLPVRTITKVPCSALFIGPDLQPDEILQFTRETLHTDCHFAES